MKVFGYLTAMAACAALSTGAWAAAAGEVDGTVNVAGHVTGICAVLNDGSPTNTFSGLIDLGELAGPDGKLSPTLTGASIAGASQSFTVICNTSTPAITLSATTMMGDATTVLSGFTKSVDYTAKLDLNQADSSVKTFTYATAGSPAATNGNLTAPLSGTTNNVTVSVNSLTTNGNYLTSGQYGQANGGTGGVITVTLTPTGGVF
jgi:hypothetical protein